MSIPGNLTKLRRHLGRRSSVVDNDTIIELCGGTDEEWGAYLSGPRVLAIVQKFNAQMAPYDRALMSEGMHSKRWQLVTVSEKNRHDAEARLARWDRHLVNAMTALEAITLDMQAPKRARMDALACLELYDEETVQKELELLKEFAEEIMKALPKQQKVIKLPSK